MLEKKRAFQFLWFCCKCRCVPCTSEHLIVCHQQTVSFIDETCTVCGRCLSGLLTTQRCVAVRRCDVSSIKANLQSAQEQLEELKEKLDQAPPLLVRT